MVTSKNLIIHRYNFDDLSSILPSAGLLFASEVVIDSYGFYGVGGECGVSMSST